MNNDEMRQKMIEIQSANSSKLLSHRSEKKTIVNWKEIYFV